jgi:HD-GYP domain-containing protein (c-di-GMP phosphodiesterase class II)
MDLLLVLESFLRNLQAAAKSAGLYPATHPTAAQFVTRIYKDLEVIHKEMDVLVVGVVDHVLVALDLPFTGSEPIAMAFAARLEERGIGNIEFHRGCRPEDVSQCVQVLAMAPEAFKKLGPVEQVLAGKGVSRVRLSHKPPTTEVTEDEETAFRRSLAVYREAVDSARRILTDVRLGKIPSLAEARTSVAGLVDGTLQHQKVMLALTTIKSYDDYLFNHSVNVGVLSVALGQSLGLDLETLREVALGAFLHDIGKVHWPESIYQKPRGLTDEEWALVQRHPPDGAEIVAKMGAIGPKGLEVILEHHLRYDRKGYPKLDGGKEQGFFGMIAQVADTYDAITTARVYQNAFEPTRAVARMQSLAGTVFDPKLLDAFIRLVGIYPVGTLVRVSSGELAVVMKPNPTDSSRPMVRVLFDETGRRVDPALDVDTAERDPASGQFRRNIVMAVDPASKNFDVAKYLASLGTEVDPPA